MNSQNLNRLIKSTDVLVKQKKQPQSKSFLHDLNSLVVIYFYNKIKI